jgi:4-amino-4-deoxy-L-arabinose transferase-like glycosyltransferase
VLILSALCGILFFYGLTAGDLYRTEGLRAIIAAEFLRSGNWIVPTLYGEPLFTKPPGMYAAIALLSWPVGGVTNWTARLPSALAATCMVFLAYWYFSHRLGRLSGLVVAAILPCSFMWLEKASAAEIDMMQAAWVTAAILFFLRGLDAADEVASGEWRVASPSSLVPHPSPLIPLPALWVWWLAALVCVAGGVLTKWTAPAFFYGTVIPLLWWRGQLRLLFRRHHLVSVAVGASLCLAWIAAAVALAGWDVFYETVSREALMRLLPSRHYRPYPWLETLAHPFRLLAMNLPWSLFALLTLRSGFMQRWDERGRRLLQALHCWIWPNVFFWSIIPEHAPRHSLPMFPGIAGLAAMVWIAWLTGRCRWPFAPERPWSCGGVAGKLIAKPSTVLVGMLALWLVVKVVYVQAIIPARNLDRQPRAKGELLAALVPEGEILYLFKLKDEGVMFYYGRAVRRLASPALLPQSTQPVYCILDDYEYVHWEPLRKTEVVKRLSDQQGDPIVLVRVFPAEDDLPEADPWSRNRGAWNSHPPVSSSSASAN